MGAQQTKKVINPNQNKSKKSNEKPQNSKVNENFQRYITQSFRNIAVNGILTKDKFNQALAMLQSYGFKRLRDTPLADRLFFIFDKQSVGYVSQKELSSGITQILSDPNNAILYTFKVYDTDGDNRISLKQFKQFIQQSWMAAFRILAQNIDPRKSGGIKIRDIQIWAKKKISSLNENSTKLFHEYDKGSGYIEFPTFKEFLSKNQFNEICAQFDTAVVMVPLNLTNIFVG